MVGAHSCLHPPGHLIPRLGGRGSVQRNTLNALTLSVFGTNAGSPVLLLPFLKCWSPGTPPPALLPTAVFSCESTRCPRWTGCRAQRCAVQHPLPTLAFSLHLQRLGQKQGRLGSLPPFTPHTHTAIPWGEKKSKTKNLLYRDIFLLYKVCTVPKKKEKGV